MVKLSGFLIGFVIIGLATAVLTNLLSQGVAEYGIEGYDPNELAVFNQLEALSNQTTEIKDNTIGLKEKEGAIDIIGGYFSSAYKTVISAFTSFSILETMADAAANDTSTQRLLGDNAPIFKNALMTIALILLIVGVVLSAIVKKDL